VAHADAKGRGRGAPEARATARPLTARASARNQLAGLFLLRRRVPPHGHWVSLVSTR